MSPMGARVFIVEDDAELRTLLARGLEEEGFETQAVGTGAALLEAVGKTPPDALVVDIGLPDTDGRDLTQALRARSFVGWAGEVDMELAAEVNGPLWHCLSRKTRSDREAMDFAMNYLLEVKKSRRSSRGCRRSSAAAAWTAPSSARACGSTRSRTRWPPTATRRR